MPDPTIHPSVSNTRTPAPATVGNADRLQNLALHYAAGELSRPDAAAFEERLATDQEAREALSEAVRLSAAALGQSPPVPHRSFRGAIRERLAGWRPAWLARQAYRGHPFVWAGLGAAAVAAATVFALATDGPEPTVENAERASAPVAVLSAAGENAETPIAPAPRLSVPDTLPIDRVHASHNNATPAAEPPVCSPDSSNPSVAEIWANLSTPDHVEKAHEDELRWRKKLQEMGPIHPMKPQEPSSLKDKE